jgi:hypothetical protein
MPNTQKGSSLSVDLDIPFRAKGVETFNDFHHQTRLCIMLEVKIDNTYTKSLKLE